jgi:PBP1b-binding outer membrane lipoprotein LpoB
MKKTSIIGATALALTLVLTGCSTTSAGPDYVQPAPTQEYVVPPAPVVTPQESYLIGVRAEYNKYIEAASDIQLLEVGNTVCETLDTGVSIEELAVYLVASSGNEDDAYYEMMGITIGAAVMNLCPEYAYQIP